PLKRREPTQLLAGGREAAPPAGPLAWLLRVEPVQLRHIEQLDEAGRNVNVGVPVARTRFKHADRDIGIRAQAVGEHTTSRACADDHVIERVHAWILLLAHVLVGEPVPTSPEHARYSAAAA